jgi:hypothetical protein
MATIFTPPGVPSGVSVCSEVPGLDTQLTWMSSIQPSFHFSQPE